MIFDVAAWSIFLPGIIILGVIILFVVAIVVAVAIANKKKKWMI